MLRKSPIARNTRKCAVSGCGVRFTPRSMTHKACCPDHAEWIVAAKREQEERRAAKDDRKKTREALIELKPLHYWAKRAEKSCNAYIRARDAGDPCMTCGTHDAPVWHAGHIYTVKARPDIRYHEDNIHLQCPDCNTFNGGKVDEYKRRVVNKIGQERLDALKYVNPAFKKTREYYQGVEAHYKTKLKALEGNQQGAD